MIACIAAAIFIYGAGILRVRGVLYGHLAPACKQGAIARVTGGHHTVKNIQTERHRLNNAFGCAHTHQIYRFIIREKINCLSDYLMPRFHILSDRKPAKGITVKTHSDQFPGAHLSQISVYAALDYPEYILGFPPPLLQASLCPKACQSNRI